MGEQCNLKMLGFPVGNQAKIITLIYVIRSEKRGLMYKIFKK